jgi:hypothetical protein
MEKYFKISVALVLALITAMACSDDLPIDEDGLLITNRVSCYVSNFELLGTDFVTVIAPSTVAIDTTAQTINLTVLFGTDLRNVYPQFTLVTDAKLDPKITGKTDFSDLANPRQYTVVSGNRKVRKTYTVNITVQKP